MIKKISQCPLCNLTLQRVDKHYRYRLFCPSVSKDEIYRTHFSIDYTPTIQNGVNPTVHVFYKDYDFGIDNFSCSFRGSDTSGITLVYQQKSGLNIDFDDFMGSFRNIFITRLPELFLSEEELQNYNIL